MAEELVSHFASPERDTPEGVRGAGEIIARHALFTAALDAVPDIVLVLNKNRQIVHCNQAMLDTLGLAREAVVGKRPGEAFGCIHSADEKAGCGTSVFCKECGAAKAIVGALSGERSCQECRMNARARARELSLDLRVWAHPVAVDGEQFIVFTLKDIADEKRRELLQRTFFHDVLNEATILLLYAEDITAAPSGDPLSPEKVKSAAGMIVSDIQVQRELLAAELGELKLDMQEFPVRDFLKELIGLMGGMKYARNRSIRLECPDPGPVITSDRAILARIVGNLIKNALEATAERSAVTVGFEESPAGCRFRVHNPEVMPESVRLQVFQRSFSTKGKGRGIGTHSVKLFTETYLKGKASFVSRDGEGTTFFVDLPA